MLETLETLSFNRRRGLRLAAGTMAGAALLSACQLAPAAGTTSAAQASSGGQGAPSVQPTSPPAYLYLTLVSDAMTGKDSWPVYVPTDLTLPAHNTIHTRIAQFDSGAGELPDGSPFAKVTGVLDGGVTTQSITKDDPNALGNPTTYREMASKDVAHTFTLGALGINVPMPVSSVVSFTFKTGDAGTFTFQCMVPCGTDPNGQGGAMVTKGYMVGTLRVV